jgi:hypothetical protein
VPRLRPREPLHEPRFINLGFVVLALTMVTPVSALAMAVMHGRFPSLSVLIVVGLFVGSVLAFVGYFLWRVRQARRLIRAHGRFLCLNCHYPLEGLPPQGRCPECDLPYDRETTERRWLNWEKSINKERPLV